MTDNPFIGSLAAQKCFPPWHEVFSANSSGGVGEPASALRLSAKEQAFGADMFESATDYEFDAHLRPRTFDLPPECASMWNLFSETGPCSCGAAAAERPCCCKFVTAEKLSEDSFMCEEFWQRKEAEAKRLVAACSPVASDEMAAEASGRCIVLDRRGRSIRFSPGRSSAAACPSSRADSPSRSIHANDESSVPATLATPPRTTRGLTTRRSCVPAHSPSTPCALQSAQGVARGASDFAVDNTGAEAAAEGGATAAASSAPPFVDLWCASPRLSPFSSLPQYLDRAGSDAGASDCDGCHGGECAAAAAGDGASSAGERSDAASLRRQGQLPLMLSEGEWLARQGRGRGRSRIPDSDSLRSSGGSHVDCGGSIFPAAHGGCDLLRASSSSSSSGSSCGSSSVGDAGALRRSAGSRASVSASASRLRRSHRSSCSARSARVSGISVVSGVSGVSGFSGVSGVSAIRESSFVSLGSAGSVFRHGLGGDSRAVRPELVSTCGFDHAADESAVKSDGRLCTLGVSSALGKQSAAPESSAVPPACGSHRGASDDRAEAASAPCGLLDANFNAGCKSAPLSSLIASPVRGVRTVSVGDCGSAYNSLALAGAPTSPLFCSSPVPAVADATDSLPLTERVMRSAIGRDHLSDSGYETSAQQLSVVQERRPGESTNRALFADGIYADDMLLSPR